ncbi:hypothetical protein [Prescottella equi]|uniref:hypothetical protein n=1 Tax=Rhodococcus hoagii TaxID=43767 RepID=UPI00131CCB38|nr:hypothetical protein [Prescottella equi]
MEPELAKDFRAQLEAKLAAEHATFTVSPDIDMDGFAQDVRDRLKAGNFHVDIKVNPDFDEFQQRTNAIAASKDLNVDIRVNPDFTEFQQRVNAIAATKDLNADIRINPDFDEFTQRVNSMAQARDLKADIQINPDFGPDFQARLTAIATARDYHIPVRVELTDIAGAEQQLNHLARDRTSTIDVDVKGTGQAQQKLGGINGVKFTSVLAGVAALSAAVVGLAGAAGGAAAGLAGIGAVGFIGAQGMGDVFTAQKAVTADGGEQAAQAAEQQRAATEALADAKYNLAKAEDGVGDAQRQAQSAQQALNDAYRDAGRELRDMNAQLNDAELSQEGAAIAVARARQRLAQVKADPKASAIDRQEADLALRQAQSRYEQSKTKTADLRTDTAVANTKGVEGSDKVQQAKQGVADANAGVVDAEHQVAQATSAVAAAEFQLAQAGATAGGSQDELAKALEKLSPAARDFFEQMVALGPAWTDLRLAVQENMFAGLGDSVTTLANNQLPGLKDGLSQVATGINTGLKQTLSDLDGTLTGLVENGTMQQFVDGMSEAMTGLSPLVNGLVEGLTSMGAEVMPSLGNLAGSIGGLFAQIGPSLGQVGAVFADSLATMMPYLGTFITALSDNLAPVLPVVAGLFGALVQALTPILPSLSTVAQVVGTALIQALQALQPAMGPLSEAFASIVSALAPILPLIAELIATFVEALAPAITVIAQALSPVIASMTEAFKPVLEQLKPILADVAMQVGTALAGAMQQLAPLLPVLFDSFSRIVLAIAPLLPQLLEISMALLPPLINLFMAIIETVLPPLTTAIEFLAKYVMPPLIDVIREWANTVGEKFDAAAEFIRGAKERIGGFIDGMKGFFTGLADGVKDVWKNIVNTIATAVGAIGKMMQKVQWVPAAGTIRNLGDNLVAWADANKKASGGPIVGPGGPTDDVIPAWLSNGEYVINAAAVAKHGPLIDAINNDTLPKFATGGPVNALEFAHEHSNFPYVWGGTSVDGADCSGWVGLVQQVAMGVANPTARLGTTYNVLDGSWPGFVPGTTGEEAIIIGANEGHMVASVMGVNIESRGGVGALIGPAADSPFAPQFTTRGHIDPAVFVPAYSADDGGGGEVASFDSPDWGDSPSGLNSKTDALANQAIAPAAAQESDPTSWSALAGKAAGTAAGDAVKEHLGTADVPTLPTGFDQQFRDLLPNGVPELGLDYVNPTAFAQGGLVDDPAAAGGSGLDATTDALANQAVAPAGDNDDPKSWSDVAKLAATDAATGYVSDALGVFGMPDELPPLMKAGQMLAAGKREREAQAVAAAEQAQADALARQQAADAALNQSVPSTTNFDAGVSSFQENPFVHQYVPGDGAEQWRGVIEAVLDFGGWSRADTDRTVDQVDIESGGDPEAVNNWDINAVNGDPSKGLLQVIGGTYNAYKSPNLLDSQTDPANNLFAGINYAIDRYGSLANIWPTRAGYATGGSVWGPGTTTSDSIPAWLSDREFVVNAKSADANRPLLEAMNRDANVLDSLFTPQAALRAPMSGAGGSSSTRVDNSMQVHISTPDLDDAFQRAKSWETARGLAYTGRWR